MDAIQREKCTAVHGVPTMFIAMLDHPQFKEFDFSSMRTGIMAGSPCPVKVMRQVVDEMNMKEITIVYGQTEASPGCTQTTTCLLYTSGAIFKMRFVNFLGFSSARRMILFKKSTSYSKSVVSFLLIS